MAVMDVNVDSGHAPLLVSFDATQSSDSDGNIASYAWTFGDGATASGSTVDHSYTDLGQFTATLTVTDDDGATSATSLSIKSYAQLPGFYTGTFASTATGTPIEIDMIVGSNLRMHAWNRVDQSSGYWGTLNVSERMVDGTVSAQVWQTGNTFPDGSEFGPVTIAGTVAENQGFTGTHSGVGDSGAIDVTYISDVSDTVYTLQDISGDWSYDDGAGFTDMISLTASGDITYSASDGCTATGSIAILDEQLNAFSFSYDLNCPPGTNTVPNGVRTGVGFVDDFNYVDSWLFMAGSIADDGTLLSWNRPKSGATPKPRNDNLKNMATPKRATPVCKQRVR